MVLKHPQEIRIARALWNEHALGVETVGPKPSDTPRRRSGTNRVLKYDLKGTYLYGWGAQGDQPGQFNGPHQLTVDQEGHIYIAEVFGGRVQKFRPKKGADPAKVIGQELRYASKS